MAGKGKKKKQNQQQHQKPNHALKINPRASLWADMDNDKNNCDKKLGSGEASGSKARAKAAWAAARAERMKKEDHLEEENIDENISIDKYENEGRSCIRRERLQSRAKDCSSNIGIHAGSKKKPTHSFEADCGHAFGSDSNNKKSKLEEEMENLLVSLNEAEVGNLSSLSATLPIELPDGNGGTLCDLKEQILANAAVDMMDRWSYHKDWSKVEARLAGQILLRVEKEEVGGGAQLRKEHYLSVVNAYAKVTAEDETASIRAENILDHLETRVAEGRSDLKPDRLIINTVMGAQAKHALSGTLNIANITAAGRMLDTLEREFALGDRTMQPTARTYSKFIDLFAKAGRAEEAAKALKRMETQYRNGNKAALPKTIHYTSVIDAIAKSDCTSNKSIAEEVLHSMLDLYSKGDNNLAPDHLAPDTIIFNTTLDAFAKSSQSDAVERSLSILEIMEQYQTSPPDIVTYNIVLNTLSHDKRYISKAKEILHFIEQSKHLRADSFSYNAVIKCCPPEEAEKLIQHWEMEYLRKNTALKVLDRMEERGVDPTCVTYTLLVEACLGDDEYLMKIFESCTKHGMLDEKLEHSFKKHGPACIRCQLSGKIPYMWRHQANRGHGGPSRRQIKQEFKKGSTGADVRKFGWAR